MARAQNNHELASAVAENIMALSYKYYMDGSLSSEDLRDVLRPHLSKENVKEFRTVAKAIAMANPEHTGFLKQVEEALLYLKLEPFYNKHVNKTLLDADLCKAVEFYFVEDKPARQAQLWKIVEELDASPNGAFKERLKQVQVDLLMQAQYPACAKVVEALRGNAAAAVEQPKSKFGLGAVFKEIGRVFSGQEASSNGAAP